MKLARNLLIASLPLTAAAAAHAQNAPAPKPAAPVSRAQVLANLDATFVRIDTNGDGVLVKAEADAAQKAAAARAAAAARQQAQARFTALDADRNGQLSLAEFIAGVPAPRLAPGEAILKVLDTNGDKKVTAAEFRARRLSAFDAADTNRDGLLGPQEQEADTARVPRAGR